MNVTRESLETVYSAKTDDELLLIDETRLTELVKEVVQKIKQERKLTEEACIAAKQAAADKKNLERRHTIQTIKFNIKKWCLYLYIFCILAQIKPAIRHGMLIIPILMALPLVVYAVWESFKSKKS